MVVQVEVQIEVLHGHAQAHAGVHRLLRENPDALQLITARASQRPLPASAVDDSQVDRSAAGEQLLRTVCTRRRAEGQASGEGRVHAGTPCVLRGLCCHLRCSRRPARARTPLHLVADGVHEVCSPARRCCCQRWSCCTLPVPWREGMHESSSRRCKHDRQFQNRRFSRSI